MEETIKVYKCDRCKQKFPTFKNQLDIVTETNKGHFWERLKVRIIHVSGINNNAETRDADLCQSCATHLLLDAVERIQAGERKTAGAETVEQQGWKS